MPHALLLLCLVILRAFASSNPSTTLQPSACVPPFTNFSFCNQSLPAAIRATQLAQMLTIDELISQMVNYMPEIPRLGIQRNYTYGIEALHGVGADCPWPGPQGRCFTSFATSSAMAASFNRTLWYLVGSAQGDEARWAYDKGYLPGLHLRGPQLNPQRDPRWGRNGNSPSEDAYLVQEYGTMFIRGGQGALPNGTYPLGEVRKALHEVKHFAAYSVEDGRNERGDTWNIGLRDLNEYYFRPFRAAIQDADVAALMCAYSAVNGTASCADKWMINQVARDHWGWTDGVVESDCGAVEGIASHRHGGWASATVETAAAALNASVSVDCNAPSHNAYTKRLREALVAGQVRRSQLERAVARVYKGRIQLGEFSPNLTAYDYLPNDTVSSPSHQRLSLDSALQSIVLLRNGPTSGPARLPLPEGKRIAVVGPNGNSSSVFLGQYHGMLCPEPSGDAHSKIKNVACVPTLVQALSERNSGNVTFVSGCSVDSNSGAESRDHTMGPQTCSQLVDLDRVNRTVAAADIIVLALGLADFITNGEGMDRPHTQAGYSLPGKQANLVQIVSAFDKPTVVVLFAGSAVGIDFIADQAHWPLLVPGFGGPHGAAAIAAVVFGDVSPSGRLPYSVYREAWAARTRMDDMSLTAGDGRTYKWLGYADANTTAAFAFGSGLGYSRFDVTVQTSTSASDASPVACTTIQSFVLHITNVGSVISAHTTLVYVAPNWSNISAAAPHPRPRRWLVNFVRTPELRPAASHSETVHVCLRDVAMSNFAGETVAYGGTYLVLFDNGAGAVVTRPVVVETDTVMDQLPLPASTS